jgi:hypothetical protein
MKTKHIIALVILGILQSHTTFAGNRYLVTPDQPNLKHRDCHYTMHGCHCNHNGKYSESPSYYCRHYYNVD